MTAELVLADLAAHEAVIERGLGTFVEVGRALAAIRDERLYRDKHATFEAYCERRWQLSRKRAYDLMGAAETVAALSPIGDTPLPVNEGQARELRGLPPAAAAAVMREAVETTEGRPTATAIRDARVRLVPTPEPAMDLNEDMWAEAADRLTKDGTVAKWDAERPYALAMTALSRVSNEITGLRFDPAELARNVPPHTTDRLKEITAAHQWLSAFLDASKGQSR